MARNDLPDQEQLAAGSGLGGLRLAVIALLAIAAVVVWYYRYADRGAVEEAPSPGVVTPVPEGSRTVTLFFAAPDEPVLYPETRQVAMGKDVAAQVGQVVRALLDGPEEDGANTIPEGTRLLDVFYDADGGIAYVDFSTELVAGHPGGSAAEYYTVSALLQTISENFPEIEAVQVLVDGLQVGTIAGHINAYDPFFVRDWR